MKNPKQKLKNILLLLTVFFAISCSKDAYEENLNLDPETSVKTTRVSLNQVLIDLNNTAIKKNLNELILVNNQNNSTSRVSNTEVYFTKKEKENVLISYLLDINSYSQEKPYFLKLIITNNANEQCKIGYLKYIPTNPETNLNLHTFTGEVQILNFNFEITAKSDYINGIKQQDDNTSSRITCVNEINVTEVKCSNGGGHGVGETCHNSSGAVIPNDAHFVVTIFERCTSRGGDLVQIIEDTSGAGNSNTGGIFPASIFLNPFLDTLSEEQLAIYNTDPNIEEYLLNNIIVVTNPAYNPLIGGDPNLIIIQPHAVNLTKRWLDLQIALDINPNLLLDIPCDQIPAWQNLTQFTPPQSVISKIEQLDAQSMFTDFEIQYLQGARGTVVNCDYFPVTINSFPTNPSTGQPFTPTQFLNHVRKYINSFINTNYSSFSPSTVTGINESQIWNSSNGLGAILHIDIPFPGGDGSVICSQHNNSSWIFTTIEVPYGSDQGEDGIHPVSGNREFGIFQNPNGSYTFYTRAVDRMTDSFESTLAENSTIFFNAFEKPDLLWNSLTNKVSNYVQNNGGSAITPVVTNNKIWRPNWYKVRQYLRGEVPLSALGCH